MAMAIGLQLFSVKQALAADFVGTLERVAAIGYQNLELVLRKTDTGLSLGGEVTPEELRRHLERLGMRAVSCHTRVNAGTDWNRVIAACHELGITSVGCSIAFFPDKREVLDFCELFNRAAERCNGAGLQLYYHNHFHEYQVFDGQTIMDLLLTHTDKNLVKFEFDTYWAQRGGADPVAWLHKLGDRCDLLHQKDLPSLSLTQPLNWLDVFGADANITLAELIKTQDPAQFAAVGEGTMDIPAILQTANELGHVRYIFVEQDVAVGDEVEGIATSYTNLQRLLKSV